MLVVLVMEEEGSSDSAPVPIKEFLFYEEEEMNTAYIRSIGDSPWYVMYGQDPVLPYMSLRVVDESQLVTMEV